MARTIAIMAALSGTVAVGLGAFGAHGLRARLDVLEDGALRLGWWSTASQYQLAHALALVALAAWCRTGGGRAEWVAAAGWFVGAAVFSSTLYAMALGAPRWLGAITPIGGTLLIVGWASLFFFRPLPGLVTK